MDKIKKSKFVSNEYDMTTTAIRQKLVDYLEVADDKKIKAIYIMVADEINTKTNDWDDSFVKELERRSKNFANGKDKTYSWEETNQHGLAVCFWLSSECSLSSR